MLLSPRCTGLAVALVIAAAPGCRRAVVQPTPVDPPHQSWPERGEAANAAARAAAPLFDPELVVEDTRVVLVSVVRGVVFSPGALPNLDEAPRAVPYLRLEYVVAPADAEATPSWRSGSTQIFAGGREVRPPGELLARGLNSAVPLAKQDMEAFGIVPRVTDRRKALTMVEWHGGLPIPSDRIDIHLRQGAAGKQRHFVFKDVPIGPLISPPQQ